MVPKKILFCTDFSDNSRPAWGLAVDYAKAFDAQLLVLHVIDHKNLPGYVDWAERLREMLGDIERAAQERLQSMVKGCGLAAKDLKVYCRRGMTSKEIVSLAQEESVDLIVVGSHGWTGMKDLVVGSVARSVLKTAHRPVLVVDASSGQGEASKGL